MSAVTMRATATPASVVITTALATQQWQIASRGRSGSR
jgi:hypothetical protein